MQQFGRDLDNFYQKQLIERDKRSSTIVHYHLVAAISSTYLWHLFMYLSVSTLLFFFRVR
jgi:hypothetical protein